MKFSIGNTVSNFIQSQFPDFYKDQNSTFILFLEAYYEWMESNTPLVDSSNTVIINSDGVNTTPPIYAARQLFNYRDIDNTLLPFLDHFQEKYLYGIPFNIIVNKRMLLKHILDVYRSKGSILCYKLLFKLIYNQDVDIYLPGIDILKPSDGTWIQPTYIEISQTSANLASYVGQVIVGTSSNTTAIVENYISEPIYQNISNVLYISNVSPPNANFTVGETIIFASQNNAPNTSPIVVGSMQQLNIINGGTNFQIGQYLKIPQYNPFNGSQIFTSGIDGLIKVTSIATTFGSLNFSIINAGSGITGYANGVSNASIFLNTSYSSPAGTGASFNGILTNQTTITYNTDIVANFLSTSINATVLGFSGNAAANSQSTLISALTYTNSIFGSFSSLINTQGGKNYIVNPNVFVLSTIPSQTLAGTVLYNTSSNVITGSGTSFNAFISTNNVIILTANSSNTLTTEQHIVSGVTNSTSLTIYDLPTQNSTATAVYAIAPSILQANFAPYDPNMATSDGSISGLNVNVSAYVAYGNGIVGTVSIVDSGRNYYTGEIVNAYSYNSVNLPTILTSGNNYANGELLVFAGGGTTSIATGFINTYSNGAIANATLTFAGSGYNSVPNVAIQTANGKGALLTTSLSGISNSTYISGVVGKSGIGIKRGYWSTTRGFLNSDKYIQDSYFYQDFSYQIKAATTLDKYKNILYSTFHPAGSEMFGQYNLKLVESSPFIILADLVSTQSIVYYTSDSGSITSDSSVAVNTLEH